MPPDITHLDLSPKKEEEKSHVTKLGLLVTQNPLSLRHVDKITGEKIG